MPAGASPLEARILSDGRIRIFIGHYGSGKTEVAVNYALALARLGKKTAIVDLDIVNPYFRSREKRELFVSEGIRVISNSLGVDTNVDVPAISAEVDAPLQDGSWSVVVDVGGDAAGSRVLARYRRYFTEGAYSMFCVLNARRPGTRTAEDALEHIRAIEATSRTRVTGLVNNTHLLHETEPGHVLEGRLVACEVSRRLGIPVVYESALEMPGNDVKNESGATFFPLRGIMREDWMRS